MEEYGVAVALASSRILPPWATRSVAEPADIDAVGVWDEPPFVGLCRVETEDEAKALLSKLAALDPPAIGPTPATLEPPPRKDEEEALRTCFRIADVTALISEMTRWNAGTSMPLWWEARML